MQATRTPTNRLRALVSMAIMCLVGAALIQVPPALGAPGDLTPVYDDTLQSGFQDWSWATVDMTSTSPVAAGANAISVTYAPYTALYFGRNDLYSVPTSGSLAFSVHGGDGPAGAIGVQLIGAGDAAGPVSTLTPTPGQWTDISIDLAELGSISQIKGLWFQDATGTDRMPIHIDSVRFIEGDAEPPAQGISLSVDLGVRSIDRTVVDPASGLSTTRSIGFPHAISDGIYGMNFIPNEARERFDVPVNRWGGNSTERYNYTNARTNIANDWYYQATTDDLGAEDVFEDDNQADGTSTIMTIPLSGWVANDNPTACSYPVGNGETYDDSAPHNADGNILCGNGERNGVFVGSADPTITSTSVDETFAAGWVQDLVGTHGNAASGGVEIYALGNEPGLWHATHRDIRPNPIGRTELINRNSSYAAAIKTADPTAAVAGPVLWSGYSYYVTSEEMAAGQRPGDVPTFVNDYLAGMKDASDDAGTRLLDIFAVNFYDDRVYNGGTDALRLESTRQLWDPSYAPADWWVSRDFLYGDGSAVIPRLDAAIDQEFPGTDLAITEYNFGGSDTLAGGLAQADVLGIFGREGLDIATIWDPYADWIGLTVEEYMARPIMQAFELYRNYDNQGSKFGDESLYSSSSDEGALAVHGARRTSDGALTVMVINKSTAPQTAPLSIAGVSGSTSEFIYSDNDASAIVPGETFAFDQMATRTYPARSATLLVIDTGDVQPPAPTPTPTPTPTPSPVETDDVMHAVSCLADNGRVDTNIVNHGITAAMYRIEFQGLTARQAVVEAGDWWRMPITGRGEGAHTVTVKRDGEIVSQQTVTISCDSSPPVIDDPEVRVVNACRSGNGYVLFQMVNPTASARPYVIEFEGVDNRSTTAAAFGQSIRSVTGRPNGTYQALVRTGATVVAEVSIDVAC